MFVCLTYSQTLAAVIAGCEAAWAFFGGAFKVLVPDNLKPVVVDADAVNPRLSRGWLDYAQHAGFITDTARVRSPTGQTPRRAGGAVRAGQLLRRAWCSQRAGMRIHGTIQARPVEVFTEHEAPALLPVPAAYDVPVFTSVTVHRDFHVEVAKALYSVPGDYLGQQLDARADSELVKLYYRGTLVKTHPRQRPGQRWTDPSDLPAEKAGYALRDLHRLIAACAGHGQNIGIYAERILDDPLPWTRMRAVYRLLGLVRRYGAEPVENACSRALDLDVISVTKVASMLQKATETTTPLLPATGTAKEARFARDPGEFATARTTPASKGTTPASKGTTTAAGGRTTTLTLIPGGDQPAETELEASR